MGGDKFVPSWHITMNIWIIICTHVFMMTLMSNMRKFMNGLELEVNLGTIEKVTSLMDFVTIVYPGDQTTGPLACEQ